jgi:hypothetical protein
MEEELMAHETKEAWERFEADMNKLGAELKRHYKDGGDDAKSAELNKSLDQLRSAADAVFGSLETASRDPEVRSHTREAARSFRSALAQTFREVGDEIEKALRKPAETR